MQNLFDIDAWRIIEHGFDPSKQQAAESIFSIGNGAFGQRANRGPEEHESDDHRDIAQVLARQ